MLDAIDRQARAAIPAGFGVVADGPVFANDLVYCWTTGEFIEAGSPDWTQTVTDAADAVLVVRRGVFNRNILPGATVRKYEIRRPRDLNAGNDVTRRETPNQAFLMPTPKKALPDLETDKPRPGFLF